MLHLQGVEAKLLQALLVLQLDGRALLLPVLPGLGQLGQHQVQAVLLGERTVRRGTVLPGGTPSPKTSPLTWRICSYSLSMARIVPCSWAMVLSRSASALLAASWLLWLSWSLLAAGLGTGDTEDEGTGGWHCPICPCPWGGTGFGDGVQGMRREQGQALPSAPAVPTAQGEWLPSPVSPPKMCFAALERTRPHPSSKGGVSGAVPSCSRRLFTSASRRWLWAAACLCSSWCCRLISGSRGEEKGTIGGMGGSSPSWEPGPGGQRGGSPPVGGTAQPLRRAWESENEPGVLHVAKTANLWLRFSPLLTAALARALEEAARPGASAARGGSPRALPAPGRRGAEQNGPKGELG